MRPFLALPVILLALGCAPRAAPSGQPTSDPAEPTLAAAPAQVGSFRLARSQRFGDPSAGTLYRYRNGSALEPDVFIYPLTETARAAGRVPEARVRAEGRLFTESLAVQRAQGRFEGYEIVSEEALREQVRGRTVHGWLVHAVLSIDGAERDSRQHLFVLGEQLVKVRTTHARGEVEPQEVDAFVHELLEGLLAGTSPADRPTVAEPSVFDLVLGAWDWANGDSTCLGNRHRITFPADRSEMLLTFEESLDGTIGGRFIRYRVLSAGSGIHEGHSFVIRAAMEGETRTTEAGEPVVWDLIMATPNRYHWHRTDWSDGGVTNAVVRCDGTRPLEQWAPAGRPTAPEEQAR